MNDIERTLKTVIESISKDVHDIDYMEVSIAWREYSSLLPDLGKAMDYLQNTLLAKIIEEHGKSEQTAIILGQYMQNLSWSLKKKTSNKKSDQDSFLKIPKS